MADDPTTRAVLDSLNAVRNEIRDMRSDMNTFRRETHDSLEEITKTNGHQIEAVSTRLRLVEDRQTTYEAQRRTILWLLVVLVPAAWAIMTFATDHLMSYFGKH